MADVEPGRREPAHATRPSDRSGSDDRALVVAAHGSHRNPRSVEPAFAHAARIRETGAFAEVRAAFWKNEPSLREVVGTLASDEVVVVPLFTSEGYFVEEVVPRELGLTDETPHDPGKTVRLADPVGTHGLATEVIVQRAESITGDPDVGEGVGLAVVGHGTERNEHSSEATLAHAARIRESGRFAEVRALFMDEPPYVDDLADHFEARDLVVVPLFVADGYHTTEDIPEDIGLTDDHREGWPVPAAVGDHRVWYAGAVGTEPGFAEVIRERASEVDFESEEASSRAGTRESADPPPATAAGGGRRAFAEWVATAGTRTWGELLVVARSDEGDDDPSFALRHRADRDRPLDDLAVHAEPGAAREIARFDDADRFRPLSGAPTLRTGWAIVGLDGPDLVRAVEAVYPASVAAWHDEREGDLGVTHFRETAARQTGIYEVVAEATSEDVACAAEACCEACVRRREWEESEGRPIDAEPGDGEFPCREPCSVLVAGLREWLDLEPAADAASDAGGAVRPGEFEHPANPYRRRFLAAKRGRGGKGRSGPDHNGLNRNGLNRNGLNRNGLNRNGLDHNGLNRNGLNRNDHRRDGGAD